MKIAICDNDVLFLDTFAKQVQKIQEVDDVETYSNYQVFLDDIPTNNYDLVFMDMDWESEKNGIDIAARVRAEYSAARIVFVSSYIDRFVEDLFLQKTNVQGILNKPVKQDILEIYIKKIKEEMQEEQAHVLMVKENNRQLMIPVSEIIYLESHNHIVDIATTKKMYHIYEPLTEIQKKLPDSFCRCHRGYLINMQFIREVKKTEIALTDAIIIPVGRSYRSDLEKKYFDYLKRKI